MKKVLSVLVSAVFFLSAFLAVPPVRASAAEFAVDFAAESKSLYLENLDTGIVVYAKEPEARRYPASTTKIMTYIVTAENVKDFKNTFVKIKAKTLKLLEGTGSSVAGLEEGESLSIYQLLNCLMIPSGNDAALVLADYVGNGSIQTFVDMMNEKAEELGCTGTHFSNPHGLNDPNHYTTVSDMAKITKYALQMPMFEEISNTTYSECLGEDRYLITTNSMIDQTRGGSYYYEYAKGIKTGSTGNDSGYCLVSTAEKDGFSYLCIAYGAKYEDEETGEYYENGAMIDSKNLYEWAFDNLEMKTIIDKKDIVKEIGLKYAWNRDTIQLSPKESYSTILPSDVQMSSIDREYSLPESIEAPVKAGDKVGTVTLSYAGKELGTVELVVSETVERSELLIVMNAVRNMVTSVWFIIAVGIIILFFLGYIVLVALYNRKKRNRRPVKKYRKF